VPVQPSHSGPAGDNACPAGPAQPSLRDTGRAMSQENVEGLRAGYDVFNATKQANVRDRSLPVFLGNAVLERDARGAVLRFVFQRSQPRSL
jgi:hypothetical protein